MSFLVHLPDDYSVRLPGTTHIRTYRMLEPNRSSSRIVSDFGGAEVLRYS